MESLSSSPAPGLLRFEWVMWTVVSVLLCLVALLAIGGSGAGIVSDVGSTHSPVPLVFIALGFVARTLVGRTPRAWAWFVALTTGVAWFCLAAAMQAGFTALISLLDVVILMTPASRRFYRVRQGRSSFASSD